MLAVILQVQNSLHMQDLKDGISIVKNLRQRIDPLIGDVYVNTAGLTDVRLLNEVFVENGPMPPNSISSPLFRFGLMGGILTSVSTWISSTPPQDLGVSGSPGRSYSRGSEEFLCTGDDVRRYL